jgi:pilus assembly protein CpaF
MAEAEDKAAKARAKLVKPAQSAERVQKLGMLKVRLHQQLVERLDMQNLKKVPPEVIRREVAELIRDLCRGEDSLLSASEQDQLMMEVMDETFGFGPLEMLLKDPTISDILINRYDQIYIERRGRLEESEVNFRDDAHLRQVIDRICAGVGRRIDETSPMADARLPDGSRVNAIIPPLALDGCAMSIRRFGSKPLQLEDLIRFGAFPACVMDFLAAAVQARCNVLISGGTGSGKTTLLNCLSRYVPAEERVITIEDAAELQLQQPHVVRLETRPANIEGKGAVPARELVKNCLRMRPDRIIVGECRGGEALDMLQAMNTGHDGSMTTIHANTPRDAISRLEVMIAMAGYDIPVRGMRQQISSAIDVVVQARRITGGRRKVTSVTEITGMEGENISMQEIFRFDQQGVDSDGHAQGHFEATGIRPASAERIGHRGIKLPAEMFRKGKI